MDLFCQPYSLLPKTVPLISKNLSLFFAHLCLTLFITMETTYDFSTDHPTAPKLTNEILESSELVTDTLLAELPCQLSREQTSGNAVNVMAILKSVVSLVNSGLVAQSKEAVVALQSVVTLVSSYASTTQTYPCMYLYQCFNLIY